MPVTLQDRPINVLREETIDQLIMNYSHEKLSLEAFEQRLDKAMEAKDNQTLVDLTADLDLTVDKDYVESKKQEMGMSFEPDEEMEVEQMVHIFGGSKRSGVWSVAKEIRVVNIFGNSEIDFSEAQFSHPTVRVRLLCLFGSTNIYVSEEINTVCKAFCVFGSVNNKTQSINHQNAPTVIIEGLVLFGGANISIRRTIKERFLLFADGLKNLLS